MPARWSRDEGFHPGGTFAFEITPVENWLELEVGLAVIRSETSTEIPIDLLLKKPWRLSRGFEFMIGAGPGWYVEPGYEITMRRGERQRGIGVAAGLLIGR